MKSFEQLSDEYQRLWDTMEFTRTQEIMSQARKIIAGRTIYAELEDKLGIPWWFIGALHMRESSCNFSTHLHNGDSLSKRTIHVPRGYPKASPSDGIKYTWLESAEDALRLKGLEKIGIDNWGIPRLLYEGERYNGFGYRMNSRMPLSPYLWSGTQHYKRGKYIADGRYSSTTVDPQLGIAPLMKAVLDIAHAGKIPDSSSQFWTVFSKWAFPGGTGLAAIVSQFVDFITDWKVLAFLAFVAISGGLAFWYLQHKRLQEYKQGRYIPAKEITI